MKSDKYESGKKRKTQQLVASNDTQNRGKGIKGRKSLKRRNLKLNLENVPSNSNKISPQSRQTVLSEYFTSPTKSSPKERPSCKPDPDDNDNDAAQKMVNVPRLLSQLLRAQVVLNRVLPVVKDQTTPMSIKKRRRPYTAIANISAESRVVQRYCIKCKILEIDRLNISKRKLCRKCGTLLVFVCVKCNASHFIQNKHMRKHLALCNGKSINGESPEDALKSIKLYHCSDCSFMTTHEKTVMIHIKHMDHKMLEGDKDIKVERMGDEDIIKKKDTQRPFIVKQDADSSRKGIRRYCPKCKKVVTGHRTKNDDTCDKCNTRLLFKCGKCTYKCNFYKTLYYHVKVKCYPNVYRCKKCDYTASLWHVMSTHLKTQKCSTIPNLNNLAPKKKSKET